MQSVNAWLASLGLSLYAASFEEHDIDAEVLCDLTDADLEKLGVSLGHRKRILREIAKLHDGRIAVQRASGERRQVTVLFCDLVGSTELSSQLDPEDLREVIRAYHEACIGVVATYDGLITRFMGDGILVCLGYPRAHEDDAERAVRVGLGIIDKLTRIRTRPDVNLRVRIGIATGLVVMGDLIGTGPSEEQTIVGETPNIAARLQAIAEPGTIVVAASTRRLLGNLFSLRELGRHDVKGLVEKIEVWAVEGSSMSESRFNAARIGDLTRFVGREQEIRLLRQRKHIAWRGEGQVLLISGEAGIGKSRLAVQLCDVSPEAHTILRYQCSPHYSNSVLHPFIMELERAAQIKPEDPPDQRLNKLVSVLPTMTSSRDSVVVPLFATLIAIPFTNRYPPLALSAAQQRREIISTLIERIEESARNQPVLAIFEDVHWADATSLEVLDRIVERIRHLPILMLVTFRPEYEPRWIGVPNVTNVPLGRLDGVHVEKMVEDLALGQVLPAELMNEIVAKTDGIPLFVEELTKAVLEMGFVVDKHGGLPALAIPATLRDSLMARLDPLADAKEIAQVGAAIGREFTYALLAAVTEQHEDMLKPALARLEKASLLFRSADPPDAAYSFKHVLIRDAAYESLLKSRRKILHARIAKTLCDRFQSIVESEPEIVAHHLAQGGLSESAVEWWRKAADKAQARAAYVEAEAHLTRALGLVDRMMDGPARRLLHLQVLTAYGNALMASKGFVAPETLAVFARARKLAHQVDDAVERYPIYYGSWATSYVRGDLTQMKVEAETFRGEVANRPLSLEAAMAHRLSGATCWFEGDYIGARNHLSNALSLLDTPGNGDELLRFGVDVGVTVKLFLALVLWPIGEVDEAEHLAKAAMVRGFNSGHAHTINYMHFHRFLFDMVRRDYEGAMRNARVYYGRVRDQGLQQGLAWGTLVNGWAAWRGGDRELAGAAVHHALTLIAEGGLAVYFPVLAVLQAEMEAESDVLVAIAQLDKLLAENERTGQHWYDSEIHRQRGELLRLHATGHDEVIEAALTQAIDIASAQQTMAFKLRATISLAEFYNATGRRPAALKVLTSALTPFGGSTQFPEVAAASRLISLLA